MRLAERIRAALRAPQEVQLLRARLVEVEQALQELRTTVERPVKSLTVAEQFDRLRVVTGKYLPFHDAGPPSSVSVPSGFRITPETRIEDIPVPGPYPRLRHFEDPDLYLQTGQHNIRTLQEVLADDGFAFAAGQRVLDFGCLTGRMMRWLLEEARRGVEIWGVDIQAEAIEWAAAHLTPPFQFATTTTEPHLPFPDAHFDLIYAGSVFTHMSDLTDAWLLELKRALRPGGRAYISFNDETSVEILQRTGQGTWDEVRFREGMRQGHPPLDQVNFLSVDQTPYSAVFYNRAYLSEKLSRLFTLKSIRDEGFGYQSVYLVQKRC